MNDDCLPMAHIDPWIDLTRRYIADAARSVTGAGLAVERSWLDPRDPRDATIIFSHPASNVSAKRFALVWDEVSGWRHGFFESGQQGTRTVLSGVTYTGGGVLPGGYELIARVLAGASEPRRQYRQVTDLRDGLDEELAKQTSATSLTAV